MPMPNGAYWVLPNQGEACISGPLRIRDVTDALRIPRKSINALMQYLKRKHLVKKTGPEFNAPYSLTDEGRAALTEMTRRLAA
jgi:predicted transcriptional regulator